MNFKYVKFSSKIGYQRGLEIQQAIFEKIVNNELDGVLLILEHNPVLTIGRNADNSNLLFSREYLKEKGVELYKTDRGGDITFHGPGQIVAYPIFNLKKLNSNLHYYISKLEATVGNVLSKYGLETNNKPEYRGVWVDDKKICAVGVRVKRWITYHGIAFNVTTDLSYFNLINPCGITEFGVTSLKNLIENVDIEVVKDQLVSGFEEEFDIKFKKCTLEDIL